MAPKPGDKRRYVRLIIELPVQLHSRNQRLDMATHNVSRNGVFIRTDNPMAERQLVKLVFALPDERALTVMGMVVHRVQPGDDGPYGPGMGIDFFALAKEDKRSWDRLCLELERSSGRFQMAADEIPATPGGAAKATPQVEEDEATPAQEALQVAESDVLYDSTDEDDDGLDAFDEFNRSATEAEAQEIERLSGLQEDPALLALDEVEITDVDVMTPELDEELVEAPIISAEPAVTFVSTAEPVVRRNRLVVPIRRRHPRYAASFLVRIGKRKRLQNFFTRDISAGGTFLETSALRTVNDLLELILVHPATEQEFSLDASVLRVVREPAVARGMALRFHALDDGRRQELEQFIELGVAFMDGDIDDVAERARALEDALQLDARSPHVHAELGKLLLHEREDAQSACAAFSLALELDPDFLPAHEELPLCYALLGDTDRALWHMRIARRLRNGGNMTRTSSQDAAAEPKEASV